MTSPALDARATPPGDASSIAAFTLLLARHLDAESLVLRVEAAEPFLFHPLAHTRARDLCAELASRMPVTPCLSLAGAAEGSDVWVRARLEPSGLQVDAGLDLLGLPDRPDLAAAHHARLVEAIRANPNTRPEDLPLLDSTERALLLGELSGPTHDPDLSRVESLAERFDATAEAHAQRPAVEADGQQLTYAELRRAAHRVASELQARGVNRGARVGLWVPRSLDTCAVLLGILRAGAAYVPLDPSFPEARVRQVAQDCGMALLIGPAIAEAPCSTVTLEALTTAAEDQPDTAAPLPLGPDDLAYVIYTSGSTGQPKGVPIHHGAACTLVRAETNLFDPRPTDRVFQGFSLAFDASVEELWLAWASGACLVLGTPRLMQAGPALGRHLAEAGVTVLSTVPTLLGLLEDPIPSLRLLILGGEACPPDLVDRWHRPGLRLVNTYGPTEATVISTWAELRPGAPVTIGRPVPNDRAYVLDGRGEPCALGVPGELHLSGSGLTEGYVGRPDLSAEKFIPNPHADGPTTARLYRTGDRARMLPSGELAFLGRMDAQVKLRGFRIELEEIEAALRADARVKAAAVTVHRVEGLEALAAFVVPAPGAALDEAHLRHALGQRLPPYMVPVTIDAVDELPTLPSGKLDRRRLPASRPHEASQPAELPSDLTPREALLTEVWARWFQGRTPRLDEDFFRDLGGHSLLAAATVSELRKEALFEGLSVPDVYAFPTIRGLAADFDARGAASAPPRAPAAMPSPWRHRLCGLAQLLSLYPLLGFFALQWLTPYAVYSWSQDHDLSRHTGALLALGVLALVYPAMYLISIAAKWLLLGRIRPGRHRVWGFYYWRWWLAHRIIAAAPLDYLVGSPWLAIYLRCMGARVGRHVHLGATSMGAFDLLEIGDESSIGLEARLSGYTLADGWLEVGPIRVGRRCFVGSRSILAPHTTLEEGAVLEDLSLLPSGGRVPAGRRWTGSPARPLAFSAADEARAAIPYAAGGAHHRLLRGVVQGLGVLLVPFAFLTAIFPGLLLINELYARTNGYFAYLVAAPLVALLFVVTLALEIVVAKWLLLGRVRPGTYDLHSGFALRKWYVDRLMALGLDLLAPLYATLYLAPWFRLLGAKLGAWAEVSTAGAGTPDLMDLGEDSFIADCVSFGPPRVDLGRVTLDRVQVGRRAFVGNSALIPGGTALGESVLVGVLSVPPATPEEAAQVDGSWLGTPAMYLPRRQGSGSFDEAATYRPPRKLVLLRAFIEQFRVVLPAMGFVILTSLLLTGLTVLEEQWDLATAVLALPLLYLGAGLAACLFVVLLKWVLMGRYQPGEKPLWCAFVWRTELISGLHENLADAWLLQMLQGTVFLPFYFRLLGARLGRRACMETTWLTEYDLVRVGDDVCLNADCTLQTHLFEDRVMKMDRVDIGDGCSVGMDAVVLYGSRMEAGSSLGDLSLLMKGETLPADTAWIGSPARPAAPLHDAPSPGGPPPEKPRLDEGLPREGLCHDAQGRPRRVQGHALSRAHAGPHSVEVTANHGRVGVDLEPCEPSEALTRAAELFLPSERVWADAAPKALRWRRWLALWTAKEAVLKALGEGFAFGLDQVELAPDGAGGLRVARIGGSTQRAEGWRLSIEERILDGRPHLLAAAQV